MPPTPGSTTLSAADRSQLAGCGIPLEEAERQLALLAARPGSASVHATRLLRPATIGDGIERIREEEIPGLLARAKTAQRQGRFLKFVPASGAASRMFRSLAAIAENFPDGDYGAIRSAAARGDSDAKEVVDFVAALPAMPLGRALENSLPGILERLAKATAAPDLTPFFELFFSGGHGEIPLAAHPKGLLPFHWAGELPRTAFAEQLAEGKHYLEDDARKSRYHFTIAEEFRGAFGLELDRVRRQLAGTDEQLDVDFSAQLPETQALALDEAGHPARTGEGRLILRPSGHGALLRNLAATAGDIVFIKNVDNILPEGHHEALAHWKLLLAGKLLEVLAERGAEAPWRVCGVVANQGEPGGGPFWVEDELGRKSLQIVESAELDARDAAQVALFRGSTHFNPVDLVVALRDPDGVPWQLERFVDPARALVAEKSEAGRRLRVYERPGLWNGAMAGWNTLFVELPAWTFAPVKTVLDLARPEHLDPARRSLRKP
ncbi:MAG: DUF4301 family protein [Thermoanaerobaculia bacterium]